MAPERPEFAARTITEPAQELSQFEPDPDGDGGTEASAGAVDDDPQWIVWQDPAGESDWAAEELGQIPSGWRV